MSATQHTLKKTYSFSGKGLHTGTYASIKLMPAPVNHGIVFKREDLPGKPLVPALAENVTNTARSTTISKKDASVVTIEHLMSALTGLGVDNALIEMDNTEIPILDGSARPFIDAILKDGTLDQEVPRVYIDIPRAVEIKDQKSGSWVRIEPAEAPSIDITVDFNSDILGVQKVHWDEETDYAREIGICRTFVFYREIEALIQNGLIKGGDVDNAIIITDEGYLGGKKLYFPDECGRHKMLDFLGDIRLAGGWLNAKVTAFKPGHTINTKAAKAIREIL